MTQLRGVLLDVDGTLVDSNDAHANAWVEAMAEHDHQVPFAKVRPLIGMGADKVLPEVLGIEKDSDEGKQISQSRKKIFKQRYLPTVKPFPQTMALLQHMHKQGLKLVIATTAEPDELEGLLHAIDPHAADLFENQASSKDAKDSKPDPDVVHAALQRGQFHPSEVVMIADTPYDIEAAGKADVKMIAFRTGDWSDEDLRKAIAIYDGPADLLAQYDTSPLVQRR